MYEKVCKNHQLKLSKSNRRIDGISLITMTMVHFRWINLIFERLNLKFKNLNLECKSSKNVYVRKGDQFQYLKIII